MKHLNTKGSTVGFTVITFAVILFLILPIFCVIAQKCIVYQKKVSIHNSVDMAVMSAYLSLDSKSAGKGREVLITEKFFSIFTTVLCENMKLNDDLTPKANSIAKGQVEIKKLYYENQNLPYIYGIRVIKYPFIHCEVSVPIKVGILKSLFINKHDKISLNVIINTELPFDK